MISFELSEQQKQMKELTHYLAEYEIRPIALEAERLKKVPEEFLNQMNQMGIHLNTASFKGDKAKNGRPKKKMKQTEWVLLQWKNWHGEMPPLLYLCPVRDLEDLLS